MGCLAVLGMVGDYGDLSNLGPTAQTVVSGCDEVVIKKSLMLFPATRPIHKALEFSSKVYIPGVTGSSEGVLSLLNEANIPLKNEGEYRTLLDLAPEETSRLVELQCCDAREIQSRTNPICMTLTLILTLTLTLGPPLCCCPRGNVYSFPTP